MKKEFPGRYFLPSSREGSLHQGVERFRDGTDSVGNAHENSFEYPVEVAECVKELGIEVRGFCPSVAVQNDVACFVMAKGWLIGPFAAERIILVSKHHYATRERIFFFFESSGVACSIPAFVMSQGDFSGALQQGGI